MHWLDVLTAGKCHQSGWSLPSPEAIFIWRWELFFLQSVLQFYGERIHMQQ